MNALRLGTRRSLLATTQSTQVARQLTALTGRAVELVPIRAEGDDTSVPLAAPPRPGAFVATLRDALLAGEVDLVVHSFKDLPSEPLPGLVVAAVPERVDPREALCARGGLRLAELPAGARVGTSSPRRAAELGRLRADLRIVPIRGNVDTRLRKVTSGEVDAVLLAAAGLVRLGRTAEISEFLAPEQLLPAPAQGALAVECRVAALDDGTGLVELLARLDHLPSRLAVDAERAVLAQIAAQCTTAVGAHARWVDQQLVLTARLHDHRGITFAEAVVAGPAGDSAAATGLGAQAARKLLAGGS